MRRAGAAWGVSMAVAICAWGAPATAGAQTFGFGPRLAFVSGADSPFLAGSGETKAKFTGGFVRLRLGRVGLEGALDYRAMTDATGTAKLTSYPIQGSILYYLTDRSIAPYLLGGVDYLTQRLSGVAPGAESASAAAHSVGYHAGLGTEVVLGRHASIYLDYRYTFVNLPSFTDLPRALAGAAFSPVAAATGAAMGLDTSGSMWTTGVTIYF